MQPSTVERSSPEEGSEIATRSPVTSPRAASEPATALMCGRACASVRDSIATAALAMAALYRSLLALRLRCHARCRAGPRSTRPGSCSGEQGAVVVLTGAGISTDSGIPDFRGPEGLWTKDPAAEMLSSFDAYVADPELRARAWQARLNSPAWGAAPNEGHRCIVELERRGQLLAIVTQNIDGLHQEAGSDPSLVIEIHGNTREAVCLRCGKRLPMAVVLDRVASGERRSGLPWRETAKGPCGGILKSATISFGQSLVAEDLAARRGSSPALRPAAGDRLDPGGLPGGGCRAPRREQRRRGDHHQRRADGHGRARQHRAQGRHHQHAPRAAGDRRAKRSSWPCAGGAGRTTRRWRWWRGRRGPRRRALRCFESSCRPRGQDTPAPSERGRRSRRASAPPAPGPIGPGAGGAVCSGGPDQTTVCASISRVSWTLLLTTTLPFSRVPSKLTLKSRRSISSGPRSRRRCRPGPCPGRCPGTRGPRSPAW